jgi:hypothetical protein
VGGCLKYALDQYCIVIEHVVSSARDERRGRQRNVDLLSHTKLGE